MSRRRTYDFAALGLGDRLVVALNGRPPQCVAKSMTVAARQYAGTYDGAFRFSVSTLAIPGFVVLERIEAGGGRSSLLIEADRARLSRLDRVNRERSLTRIEVDRIYRINLRITRRAA
jgi:hypothetical protein